MSRLVASGSQTIGPFFHVGPGATDTLGTLAAAGVPGERIRLRVQVLDGDGAGVPDALIEIWQADSNGRYPRADWGQTGVRPGSDPCLTPFAGFGRLSTQDDGSCEFETIRPGRVAEQGQAQAAHINILVFARGLTRHLYTRAYFAGDPAFAGDPVVGAIPADRRETLLARSMGDAAWELVVHLQGPRETAFFDL